MKKRGGSFSASRINAYLRCPRQYYFIYEESHPKKTDYARLCGSKVHKFIEKLYRPTRTERPFYYKSLKDAIGAWIGVWNRALRDAYAENLIQFKSSDLEEEYRKVGIYCVIRYWKDNIALARPVEIEKRYSCITNRGVSLLGIIDQTREVSVEWIECHRPEIVNNGRLDKKFSPVVLVDLKTDRYSYDFLRLNPEAEVLEEALFQFPLHEDLQATIYTYLYEKVQGKKPIGFQWYHLRSGKAYFTYRTDADYKTLFEAISHLTDNLSLQSYPKNVGLNCRRCDFIKYCREDRALLVSRPEVINGCDVSLRHEPNLITKIPNEQPKLKGLKTGRPKRKVKKTRSENIELFEEIGPFPWDETAKKA